MGGKARAAAASLAELDDLTPEKRRRLDKLCADARAELMADPRADLMDAAATSPRASIAELLGLAEVVEQIGAIDRFLGAVWCAEPGFGRRWWEALEVISSRMGSPSPGRRGRRRRIRDPAVISRNWAIATWAALLVQWHAERERDLELAELRDRHTAVGRDPTARVLTPPPPSPSEFMVWMPVTPSPSSGVERARVAGKLPIPGKKSRRGWIEPVSHGWVREAAKMLNDRALAAAWKLANGEFPGPGKAGQEAALKAISELRAGASGRR